MEVESLLRQYFEAEGFPPQDDVAAAEAAAKHLAEWDGPVAIKQRVQTCIGNLKGASPRTALRRLAERGVVAADHLEAWERVRHPAAHGLRGDDDMRELVARCDRVHQLLFLLVFHLVGYQGRFTDHCAPGWPLATYPLRPR